MGKQTPSGAGPTRRTVLVTAFAAAGGVAASRLLGLRDLGGHRVASAIDTGVADPMSDAIPGDDMGIEMKPTAMDPMDPPDMPEPTAAPTAAPATAAPTRAPLALAEPMTGVVPPDLAAGLDWVSPLDSESAKVAHPLRRMTIGVSAA